ncbi:MAG: hypothetical protein LBS50_11020 [Prevotellaceae bacterium]|jgi:hypothetical protein|nr:hypothetical protein [Prevotellaceae bacterium]
MALGLNLGENAKKAIKYSLIGLGVAGAGFAIYKLAVKPKNATQTKGLNGIRGAKKRRKQTKNIKILKLS